MTSIRSSRESPLLEQINSSEKPVPGGEVDVGGRLRTLRETRQLSIRALAEASGLAVNTLSLIENGRTSPSVTTLQHLAAALRVPISAFFEPEVPRSPVIFLKAGQQTASSFPHGTLTDLGAGMVDRLIEPLLLVLEPGAGSGPYPIVHIGQEFVYCLAGRIAYTVAEQVYLLEPGDSLLFEAPLPHRWQNVDLTPARALLVLHSGEPPGRALARHSDGVRG